MSGHNKFSKIKHKKAASDATKSKIFSRLSKIITNESKKANGNVSSPALATAIEAAKKENMPKDTIERAIKKGIDKDTASMDAVIYEAYGPGGCAIIIDGLTDNKNRSAAEVRHTLSKFGIELAAQGAASWAFTKDGMDWVANSTIELSEGDQEKLGTLIDQLEESDDIQGVYTNVA